MALYVFAELQVITSVLFNLKLTKNINKNMYVKKKKKKYIGTYLRETAKNESHQPPDIRK